MYCKVCGSEMSEEALFCSKCGSKAQPEETPDINTGEPAEAVTTAETETVTLAAESFAESVEEPKSAPVLETEEEEAEPVTEVLIPVEEVTKPSKEEIKAAKEEAKAAKEEAKAQERAAAAAEAEAKAKEKAEAKAAAEERRKYMVAKNPVFSTIVCVFFSIIATAVMFAATAIFVLNMKEFDDFYYDVVFADPVKYGDFWVLTSRWYLYIVVAALVILILLIFNSIKRRKYAIFNYVGIPAVINGLIFMVIALLNKTVGKLFDSSELFEELFNVIGDSARNSVLFAGVILLSAGALFILIYALVSTIHKAIYRKKVRKANS